MGKKPPKPPSSSFCLEMPENEEEPTAVYAKKVHKGGSDEVNRVISKKKLPKVTAAPFQPRRMPLAQFVQGILTTPGATQTSLQSSFSAGLSMYLIDSEMPQRLLTQLSIRNWGVRPQVCTNLDELAGAVDMLSTPPLFGQPAPLLVILPAKLTKGHWGLIVTQCARLNQQENGDGTHHDGTVLQPTASDTPPVWFIGPTSLRKSVTQVEGLNSLLGYAPTRAESMQIVNALHVRYQALTARSKEQQREEIAKAIGVYDTDFVLIDEHFERMQQTGLGFDDVFTDLPLMGVYQLIEALPTETLPQLILRIEQCQRNGEEPSRVLAATGTFLRQFIRYCGMTRSGTPEPQVFQSLGIPFPAQAKFTAARKRLAPDRVLGFLARCPELELRIRQTYRGPEMLAVEFIELFS